MAVKSPLPKNAVRDQRYIQIFNDIQRDKSYLEHPADIQETTWDSEIATRIDYAGRGCSYRPGRRNSTAPEIFLLGYDETSIEKTLCFIESLALDGIFKDCSFLMEGYDGTAAMISWVNPVTNPRLNGLFNKYAIMPCGKDSCDLRESQYSNLQEVDRLQRSASDEQRIKEKVVEAMDNLVKREREYFLPAVVKEKEKGRPILFLANIVHALSSNFPIVLNNNGMKYAVFVPTKY